MNTDLFGTEIPARVNRLTEAEQMALVASCEGTCINEARRAQRAHPEQDVDDLEQEARLACVEASRRWSPTAGTRFNTYATSCVRQHLANVVTRNRGKKVVHLEGWDAVVQPDTEGTEEEDRINELTERQDEAVYRLGDPARAVVRLVIVHGLSPDRVAAQLGREVKDVKLILRNAARQLPKELSRAATPGLFEQVA